MDAQALQEQPEPGAARHDQGPRVGPARPVAGGVLRGEDEPGDRHDASRHQRAGAEADEPDDQQREPRDDHVKRPAVAAEVDLEQTHDQKEASDDDQDKAHRETRARAARPRRLRGRRSRRGIGRRRHPGGGGGRRCLDRVAVRCGRHGGFGCGLGLRFGGGRHGLVHVSGRLCLLLGLRNLGKVLGRLFPVWGVRQRGPHLVELRRPVLAARVCFLGLWSVRSCVQVRVVGWFDLLGLPGTRHVPSSLNGDRRGWLH